MGPRGFEDEYAKLEEHGLVAHGRITGKGESARLERYTKR
jgi:hypothetical protein